MMTHRRLHQGGGFRRRAGRARSKARCACGKRTLARAISHRYACTRRRVGAGAVGDPGAMRWREAQALILKSAPADA